MLTEKRLLITGIANGDSIAAAVARRALQMGAQIILSAYPRDLEAAKSVAARLPGTPPVLAFDATVETEAQTVESEIRDRWGRLDGILHAIAFAPRSVLNGVMGVPAADVELALRTSVWTYAALAQLLLNLAPPNGASLVGIDFDSSRAWPMYNWMGPLKSALRSLNSYLARDLGPNSVRANLVAAGPLETRAASSIPDFDLLLGAWRRQAPLNWDSKATTPTADTACFLLSDLSRAITGEVIHADGGFHAMATAIRKT